MIRWSVFVSHPLIFSSSYPTCSIFFLFPLVQMQTRCKDGTHLLYSKILPLRHQICFFHPYLWPFRCTNFNVGIWSQGWVLDEYHRFVRSLYRVWVTIPATWETVYKQCISLNRMLNRTSTVIILRAYSRAASWTNQITCYWLPIKRYTCIHPSCPSSPMLKELHVFLEVTWSVQTLHNNRI